MADAAPVTARLLTDGLACCAGDVGTVFRRYPGMWQVFVEDLDSPGRYKLIAERPSSPAGESVPHFGTCHPFAERDLPVTRKVAASHRPADTSLASQFMPQGPRNCYAGDALDVIIQDAFGLENEEKGLGGGTGLFASLGNTMASVQRFARSLTR